VCCVCCVVCARMFVLYGNTPNKYLFICLYLQASPKASARILADPIVSRWFRGAKKHCSQCGEASRWVHRPACKSCGSTCNLYCDGRGGEAQTKDAAEPSAFHSRRWATEDAPKVMNTHAHTHTHTHTHTLTHTDTHTHTHAVDSHFSDFTSAHARKPAPFLTAEICLLYIFMYVCT